MNEGQLEQAIHNNALWCSTVCRAHGSPGQFLEEIWINRRQTPPFYPNAVTLAKDQATSIQLAYVHELVDVGIPGAWGVKDSYCALDLTSLGFRILFEAEWICRTASQPRPDAEIAGVRWGRITRASELDAWESAWSGEPTAKTDPNQARIFVPALLADENIAIFAAYQDQQIVAGAIASRTGEAVGVSNVFEPARDGERFRAGCIANLVEVFPGLPLVGYETGRDLAEMRRLGFEILGPLRVWVKVTESE